MSLPGLSGHNKWTACAIKKGTGTQGRCLCALPTPCSKTSSAVWNWWLLTLYFALASWASWYAIRHKGEKRGRKMRLLHWVVVAVFHAEFGVGARAGMVGDLDCKNAWVDALPRLLWLGTDLSFKVCNLCQSSASVCANLTRPREDFSCRLPLPPLLPTSSQALLIVDIITWAVLVPMLMNTPEDATKEFWRERLFCLESYSVREDRWMDTMVDCGSGEGGSHAQELDSLLQCNDAMVYSIKRVFGQSGLPLAFLSISGTQAYT